MTLRARSDSPYLVTWVGRFRNDRSVRLHEHAETELVMVVSNACTFEAGGVLRTAAPGEVVVLPAQIPHAQWSEGMTETRYCLFRKGSFGFGEDFRVVKPGDDPFIGRWFEDLASLFDQPSESPSSVADALLGALLERLRNIERRDRSGERLHPAVALVLERIQTGFEQDLSIDELAATAGVSASHLRALFRQAFGKSPHGFLQEVRLQAARDFLNDPYLNINEVAYRSGFRDPNYFIRVFRQAYGTAPGKWRTQKR